MSGPSPAPMTAEAFMAWAATRPDTERYELHDGAVVAMAPERVGHARAKFAVTLRLREAIAAASLDCEAIIDGVAVRIDANTIYEPDAMVRCGARAAADATQIDDPVIIVEVVSPSSGKRDTVLKLAGYFSVPSVMHYLIVLTESRVIVHHARQGDGTILTRIVADPSLRLDPPGITLEGVFTLD